MDIVRILGEISLAQLKNLVVLELASVLAGPGAGQFFAELGARVIKVENVKTSGDVTRSWKASGEHTDDRSAYFCSVNWGKQSIALDLSNLEGQQIVQKLAGMSDIIIASYKPGDASKLGVDYSTLSRDHPQLIYGEISGYGSSDPRVGYDAVIQAEAGFMSMNGEPGGKSLKMPVALVDILASHHLKEGLLLALLERHVTGQGKLVEVSLIQAAVSSLANQATNYLVGGKIPGKQGSEHPNIAPYGDVFLTRDRREILLAVGTDRQFELLATVLGISNLAADDRFRSNPSRVQNRLALNMVLQEAIGRLNSAELFFALKLSKIPAGEIRSVKQAVNDPVVEPILISDGHFTGVRTYVGDGGSISSHLTPPPRLGEHTSVILEEMLKFSPSDVKMLASRGIVR